MPFNTHTHTYKQPINTISCHVLKVSGVLAVVCFGLFLAEGGKYSISREAAHKSHAIWIEIAFICNTMIFMITGSVIYETIHQNFFIANACLEDVGKARYDTQKTTDGVNLGYLILLFIGLHFIRLMVIGLLSPALTRVGYVNRLMRKRGRGCS